MKTEKTTKNLINEFYENLPKGKKGKFAFHLQSALELSYQTVFTRIRTDSWKQLEREAVMKIIEAWKTSD